MTTSLQFKATCGGVGLEVNKLVKTEYLVRYLNLTSDSNFLPMQMLAGAGDGTHC